jgi:hypothetical protein
LGRGLELLQCSLGGDLMPNERRGGRRHGYSCRRASIGLRRAARRAGA